jgi:hypothetical protein
MAPSSLTVCPLRSGRLVAARSLPPPGNEPTTGAGSVPHVLFVLAPIWHLGQGTCFSPLHFGHAPILPTPLQMVH